MADTTIENGEIIGGTLTGSPLQGLHRVLEVIPCFDRVTLIPIPTGPRTKPENKQANYYARGFRSFKLSELLFLLETNVVKKTTVVLPIHWFLSDTKLRELSPPKNDPSLPAEDRQRSPLEIRRDFKWKLIEPLIPGIAEPSKTRPPDLSCIDSLVRARAREMHVSAGQVFDALHRYYAFGYIKNALLPNNTGRSGAPGKTRRAKNNVKLGRKNAAVHAGMHEKAGLILNDNHVQNIQDGYMMFVVPGTTVKQAYLSMSATFYSNGYVEQHGYLTPQLFEAHLRPTKREFDHHGPLGKDATGAARRLMGEGAWARDYRPLLGTARDGIFAVGHVGSLDASPVDVNFVACSDPLQPIGVGRGLFVRDVWTGLYLGWHIKIGGLGTDDAKLAILRAATDKTSLLARHNLDLPPEDFPSLFFTRYLTDNGELRSRDGIESIVSELSSRIELVATGRADRNSPSESGHHSRHRGFDHHLTGTTKGRAAKRGEPLAISKALLTRFAYERLLLLWIHWANTKQEIPLHMVPSEMQREFSLNGKKIPRTRIEIFRWAKNAGYIAGRLVDTRYLRAHLLPKFTASVGRTGLTLHRPNTGNAVELLHGARFNDEYLAHSGIIRDAISKGKKHIEVFADPDNLDHIILRDVRGIHIIPNIKDDQILIHEGCIEDLCAINDAERLHGLLGKSSRDQNDLDQQSFRHEAEADAKEVQGHAKQALGKNKAPSIKRDGVRAAQAVERREQLNNEISRAAARPEAAEPPTVEVEAPPMPSAQVDIPMPTQNKLIDLRKARLTSFNSERKF